MTITLNCRADFTLDAARRVAWGGEGVLLGAASQRAMVEARARFMRLIEDPEVVIYGVTSGYGQNAKVRLRPDQRKAHANRPPFPAAAAWGDPVPERVARAIVFARLANFVEGDAAVSPAVANGVAAMLDGGPLPVVPARGQGGAGEILSLSHLFLPLARLRALIDGGHGGDRRPYQAPVSFRILPRILGQTHLAARVARDVAEQSLPAMSDNPALLPPDAGHPDGRAVSTGGYHNAQAPMAMDMLTASYANLCALAARHAAKMLEGEISHLPPQLGAADGRPYIGCLAMAATGYEEEARMLATATLLPGSETGGFGQSDVASPVFLAWTKQERAVLMLESALAALAPVALLALDLTNRPVPGPLAALAEAVRAHVPVDQPGLMLGPATGALAEWLRGQVYGA